MLVLNGGRIGTDVSYLFSDPYFFTSNSSSFPQEATGRPFLESPRLVTFRHRKAVSVYASRVYIQDQR